MDKQTIEIEKYLHKFIPSTGDNDWVGGVGRESDIRNPFCMCFFTDGVLALTKSIPKLDGLITRSRYNLSVVSREGNTQYIFGVTSELTGGFATMIDEM